MIKPESSICWMLLFAQFVNPALTGSAFAGPGGSGESRTDPETAAVAQEVAKRYQAAGSYEQLFDFMKELDKESKEFIKQKLSLIQTKTPVKLELKGDQFIFIDADGDRQAVRILSFDAGEFEINNEKVTLSGTRMRENWSRIEQALPRSNLHAVWEYLVPDAHASAAIVIRLIAGIVAAVGLGHAYWKKSQLIKGVAACEQLKREPAFLAGPKGQQEQNELAQLMKKVVGFKRHVQGKCDGFVGSYFCKPMNEFTTCLKGLEIRYAEIMATGSTTSPEAGAAPAR